MPPLVYALTMSARSQFSANLNRLLKERGLFAADLEQPTGVSLGTIYNLKKDSRAVSIDHMEAIADYFRIPLSEMISGPQAAKDRQTERLIQIIETLSPEQRFELLDFALGLHLHGAAPKE